MFQAQKAYVAPSVIPTGYFSGRFLEDFQEILWSEPVNAEEQQLYPELLLDDRVPGLTPKYESSHPTRQVKPTSYIKNKNTWHWP